MTSSSPSAPDLRAVNDCLDRYGVAVYVGSNGRFRLAGDINNMQDVVDGNCRSLLTKAMHDDFTIFFQEVDQKIVECIREGGGQAEFDPRYGIDPGETDPDLVERCFMQTYDHYRVERAPL